MKKLAVALLAVGLGGALSGCVPNRTILDPPVGASEALPKGGPVQFEALKGEAQSWVGTPYQLGGNGRGGIDCSGFVHNVFQILGLELPRTVETLYQVGETVPRRKLRLGDLVFFRFKGNSGPTHVGIYLGEGVFIHASVGRGVRFDTVESGAYDEAFFGCRRILA
jgi:cell wall-associated NlpC family hydrolase